MEKKNWEDLVTLKLINAMNEHALLYSQLDGISGAKKNKSDVEGELRGQKQENWKSDADPLKRKRWRSFQRGRGQTTEKDGKGVNQAETAEGT